MLIIRDLGEEDRTIGVSLCNEKTGKGVESGNGHIILCLIGSTNMYT